MNIHKFQLVRQGEGKLLLARLAQIYGAKDSFTAERELTSPTSRPPLCLTIARVYRHPFFQHGKRALCGQIKRHTHTRRSKTTSSSTDFTPSLEASISTVHESLFSGGRFHQEQESGNKNDDHDRQSTSSRSWPNLALASHLSDRGGVPSLASEPGLSSFASQAFLREGNMLSLREVQQDQGTRAESQRRESDNRSQNLITTSLFPSGAASLMKNTDSGSGMLSTDVVEERVDGQLGLPTRPKWTQDHWDELLCFAETIVQSW